MARRQTDRPRGRAAKPRGDDGADGGRNGRRFVTTRMEVEGRDEVRIVEVPALDPEPWGEAAALSIVGRRVPRADAVEKVTGRARYTADVHRPGMLHAVLVRATIASGTVTRLEADRARALPGVHAVLTRDDVPEILIRGIQLFDRTIHYAGQPVAAICAESEATARRALALVELGYDVRPHAVTAEQALAPGAPAVRGTHNLTDDSPAIVERGDVARGLDEADVVIGREYRVQVALHTALEPHGAVAEWSGGTLTLWESTQGIFAVREELAAALGIAQSRVRVITQFMGGGFGAKNGAGAHSYAAALLARRLGRPVRCVLDRDGEQTDTGNRPASVQRVTLGATADGRLTAMLLDADVPLGIGGWQGGPGKIFHELYRCPNVRTVERFVYVNAAAMSSFRAPGHVEGAFGLERAMDVMARHLEMDPLELRRANYATGNQEKRRRITVKHLDRCYDAGAARFGWSDRAPPPALPSHLRRGFGIASQVWSGGGGPPAYTTVRINPDGSIDVLTGSQDLGTGARTIFAQIAAEALGAGLDTVRVVLGDTERTPYTANSWGSITTASVGPAVRIAAEDARRQLLDAASGIMDVDASRLAIAHGVIRVRRGRKSMRLADVTRELGDVMIIGQGNRGPNPEDVSIMTFGAQFAEVEVDLETGIVRVVRLVAAHDSGRIINPTLAESQLEGGIIQGIGYALFEERVLDARLGVPVNPTMHDYKIPTLSDVPPIDAFFVGGADPEANITGAKGVGEPPIIPTAPAIANAVADAIGGEIDALPMTPWRVLAAIPAGGA